MAAPSPTSDQQVAILSLYKQGKLALVVEQAEALTQQFPRAAFFWNLLGAASAGLGRVQQAELAFRQACRLRPDDADGHNNLGNVLQAQHKLDEAIVAYQCAIEINPNNMRAYNNLGGALRAQNRLDEALVAYRHSININPDFSDTYYNIANIMLLRKNFDEAIAGYQRAVELNPDHARAFYNLGNALQKNNRLDDAIVAYRQSIEIRPDNVDAINNLGNAFYKNNNCDEAIAAYLRVLEIKPNNVSALNNLGNAFFKQNKFDEAIEVYQRAINNKPNYSEAYYNIGIVMRAQNKIDEAILAYRKAIEIDPEYASAYNNMGVLFRAQNKVEESVDIFQRAIKIDHDHASAYFNQGISLLLLGHFREGWNLYEWRWKTEAMKMNVREFDRPLWLGQEDICGKTIFLHGEQGFGDTLQFCRYADLVKKLGAIVILEVQKPLIRLLFDLKGIDRIVENKKDVRYFDYHCPLLSLPKALQTDLYSIPAAPYYLKSEISIQEKWSIRLGKKTRPRVGIAWSGNSLHRNDQNRSVFLEKILCYLSEDFEYFCLQKDIRERDRDILKNSKIRQFSDEITDFAETAALCELMDLVISVDTSVAHLAGALGKQTWILLPYIPDWRWLLERDDSPWYPSVRLFRQQQAGDWDTTLERVAVALHENFLMENR